MYYHVDVYRIYFMGVNVKTTATTSDEMARHGNLFVAWLLPLRVRRCVHWLHR